MNLSSFSFVIQFTVIVVVMVILQLIRKESLEVKKIQITFLLLVSYFFIYKSDWRFCICIVSITILTFLFGGLIEKSHNPKILMMGSTVLILCLAYFKYTNFFVNSFRLIAGLDSVTLNIILPLGISFYIFSSLSYLIDVYRGEHSAEKNLLYFALYIAFFPKLMAGPIVRGKEFLPQMKEYRGIQWDEFKVGIQIFAFGLFKKIVLADHLGVFVDDVFHAPVAFNTGTIILAAISYSLQIYY